VRHVGDARAWSLFTEVRRLARQSVGPATDLYGMAVVASLLRWFPAWFWRAMDWLSHAHKRR
jgi:hypothetical protein